MAYETQKTIADQNTFTDWVQTGEKVSLLLDGTFSATVTLQAQMLDGTVVDVTTKTAAGITHLDANGVPHRAGVKTGGFTSGSINVYLKG